MKRLIYSLIILSILMFACSISATGTPPVVTAPPVVTEPPITANVTCNELSLYLDPALASGFDCQTIPEASGADMPAFAINPEYTEISLTGYALSGVSLGPRIDLFPVQRFTEIEPYSVPGRVSELQALISGGAPTGDSFPVLPVINAAQLFHAAYGVVPFDSGNGIRFLTMYGQDYGPVNNGAMVYTFQGLTGDGKYWVAVILPVSNPILPPDGSTLPGGETWDQFMANFPAYVVDIQNQLNAQSPAAFAPSLTALDALIASIHVQP